MSTFIEVYSVEKDCPIIINLEKVVEIVPWKAGGCRLYLDDYVGGTSSKAFIQVREEYEFFLPYAVQMVSQAAIQSKIDSLKWSEPAVGNVTLEGYIDPETLDNITKKGPGRPKKEA